MTEFSNFDKRRSSSSRLYEPKQLNSRHHEILRMNMLGYSNVDIAKMLGCSLATVSTAINSQLGREHAALLKSEADYSAVETAKKIRELAPRALAILSEVLENSETPAAVRARVAQDLLDRGGYAPVKSVSMTSTSIQLTGNDLENLKSQALLRAKQNDIVIDVLPLEEEEGNE